MPFASVFTPIRIAATISASRPPAQLLPRGGGKSAAFERDRSALMGERGLLMGKRGLKKGWKGAARSGSVQKQRFCKKLNKTLTI